MVYIWSGDPIIDLEYLGVSEHIVSKFSKSHEYLQDQRFKSSLHFAPCLNHVDSFSMYNLVLFALEYILVLRKLKSLSLQVFFLLHIHHQLCCL